MPVSFGQERQEASQYLSMITMNEYWMICFIEDNFHDRLHKLLGDVDLLGARHINDLVLDLIVLEKALELGG